MFGKLFDNYEVQKEKHMNRKFVFFRNGFKGGFLSGVSRSIKLIDKKAAWSLINTAWAIYSPCVS